MAQRDLFGNVAEATPVEGSRRCMHVDESIKSRAFDRFDGDPPQHTDPRTGRCKLDAIVEVRSSTRYVRTCRRHARPEWLIEAGVD